jgi:transposase-like protein
MSEITCKRCAAADYVKNGQVRGLQRYRCNACGCNFTASKPRGRPAALKALALLLYGMGNAGYRMIARLLGVSHVTVYNWIRTEAAKLPEPEMTGETVILTLDEMWHFLKKRLKSSGFGEPMTLCIGAPSPGCLVAVMMPPVKGSLIKSGSRPRPS